jgi:hypothetical protein
MAGAAIFFMGIVWRARRPSWAHFAFALFAIALLRHR